MDWKLQMFEIVVCQSFKWKSTSKIQAAILKLLKLWETEKKRKLASPSA